MENFKLVAAEKNQFENVDVINISGKFVSKYIDFNFYRRKPI